MAFLDYDSRAPKAAQRRPPPVVVTEPALESPGQAASRVSAAIVSAQPGPMVLAQNPNVRAGPQKFQATVGSTLAALAGPAHRAPLVYTGDAAGSLAVLRSDLAASYHALCGAIGEPERMDLVCGNLPAAAALGLNLPVPAAPSARLPPLLGGGAGLPALPTAPGAGRQSQPGGVAMSLGPAVGIEDVGSGADGGPGALGLGLGSAGNASSAIVPYGRQLGPLRSLSAGSALPTSLGGLVAPLLGGGGSQKHWPLGRPGGSGAARPAGAGSDVSGAVFGGSPRLGLVSGFTRPQDPEADFLGEESALVYPPAGRNFTGGASAAARAVAGRGGFSAGNMIDGMEDFRYRPGGRKHVQVEDLDDPSKPIPSFRRQDDNGQVERFLQDFARDRTKPQSDLPGVDRYRMPF